MRRFHFFINFLVLFSFLVGCSGHPAPSAPASDPPLAFPKAKKRVTNRPGNTGGGTIIVEYHKIAQKEARWDRSIVRFRKDLELFYALGFRPVLLAQFLEGKMNLAPGSSPIVFTFDDSHPSQFRLLANGRLDPDCALGVWQEFANMHPDFPIRATFFILPNSGPWGQSKLADKKFAMLKDWGCEVGSHTLSHTALSKLTPAEVEKELIGAASYIKGKGFDPFAIALPYGISPKDSSVLKKYHRAALLVGAGPSPSPSSKGFDSMHLPRIQGIDDPYGITFWLEKAEKGTFKPYVEP